METKSRYEVISELEKKKRELIEEKNNFENAIFNKQKMIDGKLEGKEDTIRDMDRDIKRAKEDLEFYKKNVESRKVAISEMITSIDDSLKKFTSQS